MSKGETGAGRRIQAGVVGAPHGIRGEVRVKSFMQVPAALADHVVFTASTGGRELAITAIRLLKDDMVVARLKGIADREAAAALTGTALFIRRDALQPPGEEEFYDADLVGLAVDTTDGIRVGAVAAVVNYGAGDLLDIAVEGGTTVLVPFLKAFVPVVDIAGGILVVTPEALTPLRDELLSEETGP